MKETLVSPSHPVIQTVTQNVRLGFSLSSYCQEQGTKPILPPPARDVALLLFPFSNRIGM